MDTFVRFLYEFLSQFFAGFEKIFSGIGEGFGKIFDFQAYKNIIDMYKNDLSMPEWVMVAVAIFCVSIFFILLGILLFLIIKKYAKVKSHSIDQDALLEELNNLNGQVSNLKKEKDNLMALKGGIENANSNGEENEEEGIGKRFSKLENVDIEYANYKVKNYNNNFTLPELCDHFRNFSASKLGLFYTEKMMRLFISALASTRLVILQGISGTGKTSLSYAWGKFVNNPSYVASVQPSWRDRTEIFGYFNEFTKKFNETELLKVMYEAGYTDDVYTTILDEMNLSRVEYYFAEMLSILEMPNKDEWIIEIVPNSWKTDPKYIKGGKLHVPANMWYIGTINNDDSTFAVTDKVYDRAMPIDINDKGKVFKPKEMDALSVNYSYLDKVFSEAMENNKMSEDVLQKIEIMDDYVIKHFRIAFGNRIVAHMKKFVPVYVACGGDEVEGVDYFLAKKVLRKFEQLNIAYIRDEIDPYIELLDKTFGKGKMAECEEFLLRLKKLT